MARFKIDAAGKVRTLAGRFVDKATAARVRGGFASAEKRARKKRLRSKVEKIRAKLRRDREPLPETSAPSRSRIKGEKLAERIRLTVDRREKARTGANRHWELSRRLSRIMGVSVQDARQFATRKGGSLAAARQRAENLIWQRRLVAVRGPKGELLGFHDKARPDAPVMSPADARRAQEMAKYWVTVYGIAAAKGVSVTEARRIIAGPYGGDWRAATWSIVYTQAERSATGKNLSRRGSARK